jgi:tetratricopeptide (TPR) repeat protein
VILLSLFACARKAEHLEPLPAQQAKIVKVNVENNTTRIETYAIIAMDAYERRDFATAAIYFEKLYDLDPQKEYLVDAIKSASMVKDFPRIRRLIEKGKGEFGDDKFINRYLVAYYLDKGETDKAAAVVKKLLQKSPDEKDYELAGILAKLKGNMQQAETYFQKAYRLKHDPKILLQLSEVLFRQNRVDEAIRLMETHVRIYGCDKALCTALVRIYTQREDLHALVALYKKLYATTKDPLYANALLELYSYEKNYDAAIAFLQKYHFDDEILLDIYTAKKDYKKAYRLAMELYQKRLDPKFLAKAAILEYESSPQKSKKVLSDVIQKFEKSVYQLDDALYYNYYAYLLIDHNIDIPKGIKLVKKALKLEPGSLFYIDTLAWGYYKEGKCDRAWELMKPYAKEKEPEIKEHIQKIQQCLKENKQ